MTTIGSLCTGYGGLDMAAELALGPLDHAWHAEVDPDASAVLAANWPGVPNLNDVTKVDFTAVEPVDILTAGYPCQPFSSAGRRKGEDDPRNRWPDVARAIRDLGPRLVVLENVRGHLQRGLPTVIANLAGLGYVGSWACVRASDVGAPHRRERVCVVARPAADADRGLLWNEPGWGGWSGGQGPAVAGSTGAGPALSLLPTPQANLGRSTGFPSVETAHMRMVVQGKRNLDDAVALLPTPTAIHWARNATATRAAPKPSTNTIGWTLADVAYAERWGKYAVAIAHWEQVLDRPAPEPTVPGPSGRKQLSPLFVEWMMGLPEGHVTKHIERRSAALRLLGNGVVPLQLAHGIRTQLSALTAGVAA